MGGYGVYRTFWETPEKFRALAVFSGGVSFGRGSEKLDFLAEDLSVFKDMPVNAVLDTADIVAYGAVRAGEGVWGSILMVPQLLVGWPMGESYSNPPPPEDFRVKNK